jgi:HD-like signal output (HDOD) protein
MEQPAVPTILQANAMTSNDKLSAATQPTAGPSHEKTMASIRDGMKRLGDLPIFSTSINKIRRISSDPDSDAMGVAKEVLKDANLSAKLLRLGNSAFYNRGVGKISVISRAVIVLGLDTVKNLTLTLKLIESFQNANPKVEMGKMLVKSYLAAGFVRDIADKCGVKDIEESYVCALLHNLGEITVAYVLPDEYLRISQLMREEGLSSALAEQAVLGTSVSRISQELATSWEFPPTVVKTMAPSSSKTTSLIKDRVSFNSAITSLAHQLLNNLYADGGDNDQLTDTLETISKATGLNDGMVENYLNESFRKSCSLAAEYGLSKKLLQPRLGSGDGTLRNKWARQFSYYASIDDQSAASNHMAPHVTDPAQAGAPVGVSMSVANQSIADIAAVPHAADTESAQQNTTTLLNIPQTTTVVEAAATHVNTHLQLQIIQEITALITSSARLSEVFVKVLDGLNRGAGFERVLLCLVTPDRRHYVGRLAAGSDCDTLRRYFSFPINPSSDLFSKTLMEGGEVLVNDTADGRMRNLLPAGFVETTRANSFSVAALRYQEKAVGFFYADCAVSGRGIDETDQRNILQFVTQARLALRLCT